MVLLRITSESRYMISVTVKAPINAATSTATKPPIAKLPTANPPPHSSMTRATPNPAPLLMPRIEGSASGLRNTACSINPHTDNAQPAKRAVKACGNRDCKIINCQLASGS